MDLARLRRPLLAALVLVLGVLVIGQRLADGSGSGSGSAPAPARAAVVAAGDLRGAAPAGMSGALVVDVVGAVRHGGLFRLPAGSRVADAVRRAGGVTKHAQLELVNLAAPLADGEQVLVPRAGAVGGAQGTTTPVAPLQLSVATAEQLDTLPGIGPATAARIVQYRQEHGTFRAVDDLAGVPGIGPARLAALKGLVVP